MPIGLLRAVMRRPIAVLVALGLAAILTGIPGPAAAAQVTTSKCIKMAYRSGIAKPTGPGLAYLSTIEIRADYYRKPGQVANLIDSVSATVKVKPAFVHAVSIKATLQRIAPGYIYVGPKIPLLRRGPGWYSITQDGKGQLGSLVRVAVTKIGCKG